MQYSQQGDVLIKRVDKLPESARAVETLVLQEGEFTGHSHRFTDPAKVTVYETHAVVGNTITPNMGKYIEVRETSVLLHEEHKPITIEPGIYEIDIVREYDYEKDEVSRVAD
jgi:hypothetical protein